MRKITGIVLKIAVTGYVLVCLLLYFFQERIIFFPEHLAKDYRFSFHQHFEELTFRTEDNVRLSGVLFRADTSKGLIFYLHGNAGSLRTWGLIAKTYTELGYDLFMMDYRGYGKSEGSIHSQEQLFSDIQLAYDSLKATYGEQRTIVLGYSIGTGLAAHLAATNGARLLILQAPYYSMVDMMRKTVPLVPTFILKYRLPTNDYLKACKMPVVIFHGNADEVIDYHSSLRLRSSLKPADTLILLNGQQHNGMSDNPAYLRELKRILGEQARR